ncbi:arylesterase [Albidovulum sp.]
MLIAALSAGLAAAPAAARTADGTRVILAFGDSLTAGYGLPEADGFVARLQDWLGRHGAEVVVRNGGVSGDTTAGGAARIGWALTPEIDAVIVTLGGNDLLRGLPPEEARANLDAILTAIGEAGLPALLVPMTAPGNYGADYKARFDAIYPALAEAHGALIAPPFLAPLLGATDQAEALARYFQPDRIHPNAAGVALIVDALGPHVLDLIARIR